MLDAALRAFILEFYDAALGGDRLDCRHAEFDGLLQCNVHAIAAGQSLHQQDVQRGFSLDIEMATGLDRYIASAYARDACLVFTPAAVEQHHRFTDGEPQYSYRMMGGSGLQSHLRASAQPALKMKSRPRFRREFFV